MIMMPIMVIITVVMMMIVFVITLLIDCGHVTDAIFHLLNSFCVELALNVPDLWGYSASVGDVKPKVFWKTKFNSLGG